MRRTRRTGSFFVCLLFNMLINAEGAIPAVILFVLHFVLGWSLLFAAAALLVWIAGIVIWMLVIGWARKCGDTPDPPKANKNPYSAKNFPGIDK